MTARTVGSASPRSPMNAALGWVSVRGCGSVTGRISAARLLRHSGGLGRPNTRRRLNRIGAELARTRESQSDRLRISEVLPRRQPNGRAPIDDPFRTLALPSPVLAELDADQRRALRPMHVNVCGEVRGGPRSLRHDV